MAAKSSRSRSSTSATDEPPLKVARTSSQRRGPTTPTVTADAAKVENKNNELAAAFEALMYYESKDGNRWAGSTYNKLVKLIRARGKPITSGSDLANVDGVGKASVEKIGEFLSSGKIAKLEKLKELHGPLPSELLGSASTVATAKSAGSKKAPSAKSSAAATPAAAVPLTKAQLKAIETEQTALEGKSIDQLKEVLRRNNQIVGGTKSELIERVAQGVVLGAIPNCPLCGGGRLRFDSKKGLYSCPGYMDDDKFQPCFFKSTAVTRSPWNAA